MFIISYYPTKCKYSAQFFSKNLIETVTFLQSFRELSITVPQCVKKWIYTYTATKEEFLSEHLDGLMFGRSDGYPDHVGDNKTLLQFTLEVRLYG